MKITKKMQEVIDMMMQLIPQKNDLSFACSGVVNQYYSCSDCTGSCEGQCPQNCSGNCHRDCTGQDWGNCDH